MSTISQVNSSLGLDKSSARNMAILSDGIPQYCICFCVLCYAGAGFLAAGLVTGSVVADAESELLNPNP